jgi:hypothetical protein
LNGGPGYAADAYLAGTLAATIDTPGNYVFTASYPGDANYLGSQSGYAIPVTVVDTTFKLVTPLSNMTIAAAGQSGSIPVTFHAVDSFAGQVTVTCTLPAAMTEATCPAVSANLGANTAATAELTITTTSAHAATLSSSPGKGLGYGVLVWLLLFAIPGSRRRKFPLGLLVLVCMAGFGGCGGGGGTGRGSSSGQQMDLGTPVGTYTVNVTATSINITRTGSFTVTVQ